MDKVAELLDNMRESGILADNLSEEDKFVEEVFDLAQTEEIAKMAQEEINRFKASKGNSHRL